MEEEEKGIKKKKKAVHIVSYHVMLESCIMEERWVGGRGGREKMTANIITCDAAVDAGQVHDEGGGGRYKKKRCLPALHLVSGTERLYDGSE